MEGRTLRGTARRCSQGRDSCFPRPEGIHRRVNGRRRRDRSINALADGDAQVLVPSHEPVPLAIASRAVCAPERPATSARIEPGPNDMWADSISRSIPSRSRASSSRETSSSLRPSSTRSGPAHSTDVVFALDSIPAVFGVLFQDCVARGPAACEAVENETVFVGGDLKDTLN